MRIKLLTEHGGGRSYAVILETGDAVIEKLEEFARRYHVRAARFTAIGALREATLAFFNPETKDYEELPVQEQVEVTSLVGDVATKEGEPELHIHCVLGRRDGTAITGHLRNARVRPTLEVFMDVFPVELARRKDKASGLDLIRPE